MVHALHEAWRVLKPGSHVIDLRPAIAHGKVGITESGRFVGLASMRGSLAGYRAASQALVKVKAEKFFIQRSAEHFTCEMVFSSVADLKEWLLEQYEPEWEHLAGLHATRVEKALVKLPPSARAAGKIPFVLRVLEKRPHGAIE
jgi:hypothetical protein